MLNQDKSADSGRLQPQPGEGAADYRARTVRQQAEAAEQRRLALKEQSSVNNSPERRIRIWEHMHALPLPRSASHPLLAVVAKQTGLTLQQVLEEQRLRVPSQTDANASA